MPQPLSQRKELLFVFRELEGLIAEREAIPEAGGVESEGRRHLFRLYPLLAGAVRAAGGDEVMLKAVGGCLDVVGGEFGI